MDANEALRRYLEQRRELGESELVLDSLSVEDAMKLLGAAKIAPRQATPVATDWRAAVRAAGGAPEARPSIGTPAIPEEDETPSATPPPVAQDANAATTAPRASQGTLGAVRAPTPSASAPVIPLADIPSGLVVGSTTRALFEDSMSNFASLKEIAEAVAKCRRCQLYLTAKNPVPGTGNPNADFMVVGEAPGASEDEQGVPFVGQAGQLLTKILEAIQLKRDDVFIVNVLKHRPPGNRNPLPEEVAACSPYLVRQIELVRPKVILALGTFAAQTLLETKNTIGKLRGQIHRYYGVPLIVTYHPAALLRNPAWKRPTWEDVQLARRILDQ
jgi:DNA polymerase